MKSSSVLEWNTRGNRSQTNIAGCSDAHNGNMAANKVSLTSSYKKKVNPTLGTSLKMLHRIMTKMCTVPICQTIYDNVEEERGCKKSPAVKYANKTRWNSEHEEAESANANQYDLEIAWKRMTYPGGAAGDFEI